MVCIEMMRACSISFVRVMCLMIKRIQDKENEISSLDRDHHLSWTRFSALAADKLKEEDNTSA